MYNIPLVPWCSLVCARSVRNSTRVGCSSRHMSSPAAYRIHMLTQELNEHVQRVNLLVCVCGRDGWQS